MFKAKAYAEYLEKNRIKETIPEGKVYIHKTTFNIARKYKVFENQIEKDNWILINDTEIQNFVKSQKEQSSKTEDDNKS